MRRTIHAGFALLLAPAAALAFETVDTLPYPSSGRFPAYPAEEVRPTEVFFEGGLMHDTNVTRVSSPTEYDNIGRFGAGGRTEQRLSGRQSVRLEGRGDLYWFENHGNLDHFAYAGSGTWLWELGNDLAGTIGYGRVHRLASLAEVHSATKRMITTDDIFGSAAYRLGPSVRLRGLALMAHAIRETPGTDPLRLNTVSTTAGIDYVAPLGNFLGVEMRRAHGDAPVSPTIDPNGMFVGNDYHEREASVVAGWISTPTLHFTGRIGRTERTYADLPNSDFEGTTYRFGVEWLPDNKTILAFEAYKELRAIVDLVASHALVRGVSFGPAWAPTTKLVLSLRLVNEHRSFIAADANDAPPGTLLDETVRVARFGIGWEPVRLMHVGIGIDRGMRESNARDRNYNYTATMTNIRMGF